MDERIEGLLGCIAMQPPPDLRPLGMPDSVATAIEPLLAKDHLRRPSRADGVVQIAEMTVVTGYDKAGTRSTQTIATPGLGSTSTVSLEVRHTTGPGGRDFAALSEVRFAG